MAKQPTPPGSWFSFVVCGACDCQVKLDPVSSPEQQPTARAQGRRVTCPYCQDERTYPADLIRRGRVAEG